MTMISSFISSIAALGAWFWLVIGVSIVNAHRCKRRAHTSDDLATDTH